MSWQQSGSAGGPVPARAERSSRDAASRASAERRHALLVRLRNVLEAERRLVRRYEKALECACDAEQAAAWRAGLAAARGRTGVLAWRLGSDAPPPRADAAADEDCLIGAMELALRNGDAQATQAVARECVLLAESQCARVRGKRAAWPHPAAPAGAAAHRGGGESRGSA